jgi:protein-S-isoprenylcysteine O-methyltransferase Ste14
MCPSSRRLSTGSWDENGRKEKDMTADQTAQPNPDESSGVKILPPLVYVAGLAAGFLVQWAWPLPLVPAAAALPARLAGWVLVAAWLALCIWALVTFQRAGTTPYPTRPTTALTFDGPYRFTRNPMYLSFAAMQTGVALIANALWPLVFLLPVLVAIRRLVIDREERYLERKFGEEYLAYKRSVRRWL